MIPGLLTTVFADFKENAFLRNFACFLLQIILQTDLIRNQRYKF